MPAIWGLAPLTSSIESDEAIRLSTGVTVDLSEFHLREGKKPSAKAMADIVTKVQAAMDTATPLADLPTEDPDKTATDEDLATEYNERRFLVGVMVVSREVLFSLTWTDGRLVPRWETVR